MCTYIMARTINLTWDDDEVRFVLDHHDVLDSYSARWLTLDNTEGAGK